METTARARADAPAATRYTPPPEARAIPDRTNLVLAACLGVLNVALLVGVPHASAPVAAWGFVTLAVVVTAPMHWALIHEGIHRLLVTGRGRNDVAARALSIAYGAPFAILKFGHLFHHRHNRTPLDRTEHFAERGALDRLGARLSFYFRLFGGLYLGEVVLGLALLLPAAWLRAGIRRSAGRAPEGYEPLSAQIERELLAPATLAAARIDALVIAGLAAAVAVTWGTAGWLVAVTFFLRGAVVSLLDNAFHYGGPLDELHAAYNARLPVPLARLVLNSNYHGIHHRYPRVPWRHLATVHAAAAGGAASTFDGGYAGIVARQLRGPIFEREAPGT